MFQSYADALIAVEWNKDTNYYSNIVESLSRDLHCFCVQVNTLEYGDSRITRPSKTECKDILKIKDGPNTTILIDDIDLSGLRDFQLKGNLLQSKAQDSLLYKQTPPDLKYDVVSMKQQRTLWEWLKIRVYKCSHFVLDIKSFYQVLTKITQPRDSFLNLGAVCLSIGRF